MNKSKKIFSLIIKSVLAVFFAMLISLFFYAAFFYEKPLIIESKTLDEEISKEEKKLKELELILKQEEELRLKEIELQKALGYRVDMKLYKDLYKPINNNNMRQLAVRKCLVGLTSLPF